ncbi:hypothetical protein P7H20_26655 [Paenibacillus larvae]|nr:hypothetical protein [Paenibacillus larvae]MDT2277709.1 hypothetical protein [Paenibacillus larvae]
MKEVIDIDSVIPSVNLSYSLADVATSVGNWFGSYWPILAFAVAIPLSFMVAGRIKNLFA